MMQVQSFLPSELLDKLQKSKKLDFIDNEGELLYRLDGYEQGQLQCFLLPSLHRGQITGTVRAFTLGFILMDTYISY
jgi:hypothetical protein